MGSELLICLLISALSGPAIPMAPLEVQVRAVGAETAPPAGTVTLRPAGSEAGEPRKAPISAGKPAHFEVPVRSAWEVSVDVPGGWSRSEVAQVVDGRPQAVTLDLYPVGKLIGAIRVPAGAAAPTVMKVRFRSVPGAARSLPEMALDCPVTAGRFECALPAGEWDVRLRVARLRTRYVWGMTVPARGSRDLGTLDLQPGATVVGWLDAPGDRGARLEQAVVEMRQLRENRTPGLDDPSRQTALQRTTHASSRGFFEIAGLAGAYPGCRMLTAYSPGAVKAWLRAASGSVKPYFGDTRLSSDAAGKFEIKGLTAVLPEQPTWRVEVVNAHLSPVEVRPLAETELCLPASAM